jgi:hypothetical protein
MGPGRMLFGAGYRAGIRNLFRSTESNRPAPDLPPQGSNEGGTTISLGSTISIGCRIGIAEEVASQTSQQSQEQASGEGILPTYSLAELSKTFPNLTTELGVVFNLCYDSSFADIIADGNFSIDSKDVHENIKTILASDTPREHASDKYYSHGREGFERWSDSESEYTYRAGWNLGERLAPRELPVRVQIYDGKGKLDVHDSINIDALCGILDASYNAITDNLDTLSSIVDPKYKRITPRARGEYTRFTSREGYVKCMNEIRKEHARGDNSSGKQPLRSNTPPPPLRSSGQQTRPSTSNSKGGIPGHQGGPSQQGRSRS